MATNQNPNSPFGNFYQTPPNQGAKAAVGKSASVAASGIGGISTIAVETTIKFNKAISAVETTAAKFTGTIKNAANTTKNFVGEFTNLNKQLNNFKQIDPGKQFKTLEDALTINFRKVGLLAGAFFEFQQGLDVVKTAIEGVASVLEAASGSDLAESLFEATGAGTEAIAKLNLLKQATFGNIDAIKSFGAVSTAELIKFENALERVNTIAKLGPTGIRELKKSTLELAASLKNVESSAAILNAQYEVLSGGFTKTADSQQVTAASVKLNTVGFGNLADSAQLLVKSLRAYGESSTAAEVTASKLQKIVELGITTIPELSQNFGETATVAKAAGVDINELGAAIATLTSKGQSTPTALTGIESVLRSVIDQSPEATEAIAALRDSAGKPIKFDLGTVKSEGLVAPLVELNKALKGNASELRKIFPDAQAFQTVLGLVGDGAVSLKDNVAAMRESTVSDFDAVFESVAGSKAKTIEAVINKVNDLFIKFGESFAPPFLAAVETISKFVDFIKAIPDPIKEGAASLGVFLIGLNIFTSTVGATIGAIVSLGASIGGIILFSSLMSNGFNILNSDLAKNITIVNALANSNAGLLAILKQTAGIDQTALLNEAGRGAVAEKALSQISSVSGQLDKKIEETKTQIENLEELNKQVKNPATGTTDKESEDNFKRQQNSIKQLKDQLLDLEDTTREVQANISKNTKYLNTEQLKGEIDKLETLKQQIKEVRTTAEGANVKVPTKQTFAQTVEEKKANIQQNKGIVSSSTAQGTQVLTQQADKLSSILQVLDANLANNVTNVIAFGQAIASVAAGGVVGLINAGKLLIGVLKGIALGFLNIIKAFPILLVIAAGFAAFKIVSDLINRQKEFQANSTKFTSTLGEEREQIQKTLSESLAKLKTTANQESAVYRRRKELIKDFTEASISGNEAAANAYNKYLDSISKTPEIAATSIAKDLENAVKSGLDAESNKNVLQKTFDIAASPINFGKSLVVGEEKSDILNNVITKAQALGTQRLLSDNPQATEEQILKRQQEIADKLTEQYKKQFETRSEQRNNGLEEGFKALEEDNKKVLDASEKFSKELENQVSKGLIASFGTENPEIKIALDSFNNSILKGLELKQDDVNAIVAGNKAQISDIETNISNTTKALEESREADKKSGISKSGLTEDLENQLKALGERKGFIEKLNAATQELFNIEQQRQSNRKVFAEKTGIGRLNVAAQQTRKSFEDTLKAATTSKNIFEQIEANKNLETKFNADVNTQVNLIANLDSTEAEKKAVELLNFINEQEKTDRVSFDNIKKANQLVIDTIIQNNEKQKESILSVGFAYEALGQTEVASARIAKQKVADLNVKAARSEVEARTRVLNQLGATADPRQREEATKALNKARANLRSAEVASTLQVENDKFKDQTDLINLLSENYKALGDIRRSVFEAVGSTGLAAQVEAELATRQVADNEKLLEIKREQIVLQQKLNIATLEGAVKTAKNEDERKGAVEALNTAKQLNEAELKRLKIQEDTSRLQAESTARAAQTRSLIAVQEQAAQRLKDNFDIAEKTAQLDVKRKESLGDLVGSANRTLEVEKQRSALLPSIIASEEKIAAIKNKAALDEIDLQIKSASDPKEKAKLEAQKSTLQKDIEISNVQRRQTAELAKQNQAYQEQEAQIASIVAPLRQQLVQFNLQKDVLETQADTLELRNSLISKAYDLEKELAGAFNATAQAAASYNANRLSILGELTDDEEEQKDLARQAAEIKLQALIAQQQSEDRVLKIQYLQQKALLEQEKIRTRISKLDIQGKVLETQGKVAELQARAATAKTPEEARAAQLQISAAQQQIALFGEQQQLIEQQTQFLDTQSSQQDVLYREQLQAKQFTDAVARDSARADVFKNLAPDVQDQFREQFKQSITRNDLARTGLNVGSGGFLDSGINPQNNVNQNRQAQNFAQQFQQQQQLAQNFAIEGSKATAKNIEDLNEKYKQGATTFKDAIPSPSTLEDLNKRYAPDVDRSKLPSDTKLEVPRLNNQPIQNNNTSNAVEKKITADFNVNIKVEGTENSTTRSIEDAARDVFGKITSQVKSLIGV